MLWRALGDVEAGFFIDVGAQHPIKDSVSKIFSEHGWRGIHVEPTPEFSDMLRNDRPNETVIAAVVSENQGTVTFFNIADTGLSTGRRDIAEAHAAAGYLYREITVPTVSLDDLLALAPSDDIHWLKIDVEGMEREVLESWRTSLRRPWIVVIEANLPGSQTPCYDSWEALILAKGYHYVYYDGLNRFYISNEHRTLDAHFEVPPNIFDGFQFDPLSEHAIIVQQLHKADITALESQLTALQNSLADVRSEAEAFTEQCRIDADRRVAEVRRKADAELVDLREQERSRAESQLAEIVERERHGAIAAAACRASLEQQISTLRATSNNDREQALAYHAEILEQAKANKVKIARITDAAAKQERSAQRRISELERCVTTAHAETEALAIKLSRCENLVGAVIDSRSWALAKPLRWLLREKTIHRSEPEFASAFTVVSLSGEHTQSEDFREMSSQPAQSIISILSLAAPDFVNRTFRLLLGRAPSAFEQRARERSLYSGFGRIAMFAEIYGSFEATSRREKHRAEGSDTEFIEWLYRNYLGRVADSEGLAHYEALIKRKGRASVQADLAASNEAIHYQALPYEVERLVKIYRRSRQWWRGLGRQRWERQIRNIESEANAVRTAPPDA